MTTRPPMIRTDESNNFANHTMRVRVLETLDRILEVNPDYPKLIQDNLLSLKQEIVNNDPIGMISNLAPDYASWQAAHHHHKDETWLNTVWFFAETYFYRRVMEAVRWWETRRDPFHPIKAEEYGGDALWKMLESTLAIDASPNEKLVNILKHVLWGNRIDLSFADSLKRGMDNHQDDLLVDDSETVIKHLLATNSQAPIHLIADNAGTELTMDLVLIDALLNMNIVDTIYLHLKIHPTFVSDAIPSDMWWFLDMCEKRKASISSFGKRLGQFIHEGRLRLIPHFYWNNSVLLWDMPVQLMNVFKNASLTIVKGDANYRRIVGDAIWKTNTPFADVMSYFPSPIVALRTLKSDPIVGLLDGMDAKLDAIDSRWRVNGQRGVIQFKP